MVRFIAGLLCLGLALAAASDRARAANQKDILVHANALVCKDVSSLNAGIAAWQDRNLDVFRTYQESGDCFLTKSTAKGTLVAVTGGRATIVIDYFLVQTNAVQVPAGTELWAMEGTYSRWPENWDTN